MRLPVSSRQFLLRQEDIPVSFDHHIGTSQLSETFSPLRWTSLPVIALYGRTPTMEPKPFAKMQSLTRIIEDHRRGLEQIRSFGRTSDELRRTLDQIRSLTEMPEAVRRSLEEIRSVGRMPEELRRAMEQMRLASQSEALKRSLEQMRAVTAIPEELKRGLEEIRSFTRIPEQLRLGLEQLRLSTQPEGHPLARLRRFAAEQQEVTWCCVQFGVEEAGRSGSRRPSRHWCFVPVH